MFFRNFFPTGSEFCDKNGEQMISPTLKRILARRWPRSLLDLYNKSGTSCVCALRSFVQMLNEQTCKEKSCTQRCVISNISNGSLLNVKRMDIRSQVCTAWECHHYSLCFYLLTHCLDNFQRASVTTCLSFQNFSKDIFDIFVGGFRTSRTRIVFKRNE